MSQLKRRTKNITQRAAGAGEETKIGSHQAPNEKHDSARRRRRRKNQKQPAASADKKHKPAASADTKATARAARALPTSRGACGARARGAK
jgi:hypothetical protein